MWHRGNKNMDFNINFAIYQIRDLEPLSSSLRLSFSIFKMRIEVLTGKSDADNKILPSKFGVENKNITSQAWYITWRRILQATGNQPRGHPSLPPQTSPESPYTLSFEDTTLDQIAQLRFGTHVKSPSVLMNKLSTDYLQITPVLLNSYLRVERPCLQPLFINPFTPEHDYRRRGRNYLLGNSHIPGTGLATGETKPRDGSECSPTDEILPLPYRVVAKMQEGNGSKDTGYGGCIRLSEQP